MFTPQRIRFAACLITAAWLTVPAQGYGNPSGVGIGLYVMRKFRADPPPEALIYEIESWKEGAYGSHRSRPRAVGGLVGLFSGTDLGEPGGIRRRSPSASPEAKVKRNPSSVLLLPASIIT